MNYYWTVNIGEIDVHKHFPLPKLLLSEIFIAFVIQSRIYKYRDLVL